MLTDRLRGRRPRGPLGSGAAAAAAVTATTAGVLPAYLVGVLSVQLSDDLGFGPSLLGALIASFFATSAVAALTAGTLVRRLGPVAVVRLATALAAGSMVAIGLLARDTVVLVVALVVGGWGNGIGQPASNELIARAVATSRQGLAYGLKQAAIPVATLLAGAAIPLIAIPFGWRVVFALAAALAVVVLLSVPSAARLGARGTTGPTEAAGPFRRAPLLVLAAGLGLGAATGNVLGSFFVVTAVDAGIAPSTAGVMAAVASGAGALVRVVLGWLADRVRSRWLLVVAAQMAIGGFSYALMSTGLASLIAAGAVIGYCTGWAWAGLATFAITRMHHGMAARATSITQGGMALGAAAGPLVFGAVASATSYAVAWSGTAAFAAVAAVVIVLGRRMLMHERPALVAAQRARHSERRSRRE